MKKNGKKEIVQEVIGRGFKAGSLNERNVRTNIQIGRPDIAFYGKEFLLKDFRVMKSLLEFDLLIEREVEQQWEMYQLSENNLHPDQPQKLNGNFQLNLKLFKSQLFILRKIWILLKKRHALLFDYFMTLCFIENSQALFNQIEEAKRYALKSPITIMKSSSGNVKSNIKWLYYLYRTEKEMFQQKDMCFYYESVRENFYEDYNTLRRKINKKFNKRESLVNEASK